jgi:outer membrane murein-binding lipoprotein Lpp
VNALSYLCGLARDRWAVRARRDFGFASTWTGRGVGIVGFLFCALVCMGCRNQSTALENDVQQLRLDVMKLEKERDDIRAQIRLLKKEVAMSNQPSPGAQLK